MAAQDNAPKEANASIKEVNDKIFWRNAAKHPRKLEVKPITSDYKEWSMKVIDTVTGKEYKHIGPPLLAAGSNLWGLGVISKQSKTKEPHEGSHYAVVVADRTDPKYAEKNPNWKEEVQEFFKEHFRITLDILEQMFDNGSIRTPVRTDCIKAALRKRKQQLIEAKEPFQEKDLNQYYPGVREIALRKWFKSAGAYFNTKKEEDPNAEISAADVEEDEDEIKEPDSCIGSLNPWIAPRNSHKKDLNKRYEELVKDLPKPLSPNQIYKYMIEAGFIYRPIAFFEPNQTDTIRQREIAKFQQTMLEKKQQLMRRALETGTKFNDVQFEHDLNAGIEKIKDIFVDMCPPGSVVQFEWIPEPYSNKSTDAMARWGIRWRLGDRATRFVKGVPGNNMPMMTTVQYAAVEEEINDFDVSTFLPQISAPLPDPNPINPPPAQDVNMTDSTALGKRAAEDPPVITPIVPPPDTAQQPPKKKTVVTKRS